MLHLVRGSPGTGWTWSLWWLCASFTVLRKLGSALGSRVMPISYTRLIYFTGPVNLFHINQRTNFLGSHFRILNTIEFPPAVTYNGGFFWRHFLTMSLAKSMVGIELAPWLAFMRSIIL